MKRSLCVIFILGLLGSLVGCATSFNTTKQPTLSPTQFLVMPLETQGRLVADTVVYSGPGISFNTIVTLKKGNNIKVIGISSDLMWYLISGFSQDDKTIQGWILSSSLTTNLQIPATGSTPTITITSTNHSGLYANTPGSQSTLMPANTLNSVNSNPVQGSMTAFLTMYVFHTPLPQHTFTGIVHILLSRTSTRQPPTATKKPIIKQPTLPPTPPPTSTKSPIIQPTSPFIKKSPTPTPGK